MKSVGYLFVSAAEDGSVRPASGSEHAPVFRGDHFHQVLVESRPEPIRIGLNQSVVVITMTAGVRRTFEKNKFELHIWGQKCRASQVYLFNLKNTESTDI
jgi:hypothetical protein